MKVARILYPVKVLGPGNRIGIWVCGCKRACKGCANPELWDMDEAKEIPIDKLIGVLETLIKQHEVDGITISGGEPFLQTEELDVLIQAMSKHTRDILVFTGYRREVLVKRKRLKEPVQRILDSVAVLVDGAYLQEKNQGHPLKGSANQRIMYRDKATQERYQKYIEENMGKNLVQNFKAAEGFIAVGIHRRDFGSLLEEKLTERGLRRKS